MRLSTYYFVCSGERLKHVYIYINVYDNNKLLIIYNYIRFIVAPNELYILLVLSPTHAPANCSNSDAVTVTQNWHGQRHI